MINTIEARRGIREIINIKEPLNLEEVEEIREVLKRSKPDNKEGGSRWRAVLKFGVIGFSLGAGVGFLTGTPVAVAALGSLIGGSVGFLRH